MLTRTLAFRTELLPFDAEQPVLGVGELSARDERIGHNVSFIPLPSARYYLG